MSFTVKVTLPLYTGVSNITLRIVEPGTVDRVNGNSDDSLADSNDGLFVGTVAEDLVGRYQYRLLRGASTIQVGWLKRSLSQTVVLLDDPRDFPATLTEIDEAASCDGETGEVAPLLDPDGIGQAMAAPASMTVEGNTVSQHSLRDQIEADKYRRKLLEAEKPVSKRIGIGRFVPPGTT